MSLELIEGILRGLQVGERRWLLECVRLERQDNYFMAVMPDATRELQHYSASNPDSIRQARAKLAVFLAGKVG